MTARIYRPGAAFLVAAAGIGCFSTMDAVMKGLVLALGAWGALFWRGLIGVALTGALYAAGRPARPAAAVLRLHLLRGVVATVMALLFFWGLARMPIAQAVALSFVAPLLSLGLSALLLGEHVGRSTLFGSLLALGGVSTILVGQQQGGGGDAALAGAIAVLLSALCYAFNIVLMRRQALVAKPAEVAFAQNLIVTGLLALAAPVLATPPAAELLPALALAAVLSIVSALALAWAYARAPASFLSMTEYSAFIWASLFGWLIFAEPLRPLTVAGAALIVLGCVAASRRRPIPANPPEATVQP